MPNATQNDIHKTRQLSLGAILVSAFAVGVAFGGLLPLLSISMESRGVETWLIGANSGISSVGLISVSFFVPKLIRFFGPIKAFAYGSVLVFISIVSFTLSDQIPLWFVFRFALGLGLALPWVVSETWLIAICQDHNRGRVMALYTTILAGGFAAGPLVLTWVGTTGHAAFYVYAGFFFLSALPIMLIRKQVPDFDIPDKTSFSGLARAAPTIFLAAMISGALNTVIFSFLPIYGIRLGFDETTAVLLLSSFLMGNLVLQYPIGWFADQYNARAALIGCAACCVAGPLFAIFVYSELYVLSAVFFVWGGASWSIYAIGLTMIGKRFRGGELAAASSAFLIVFEFSNIVAPPTAGHAMDVWDPHGLMVFLSFLAVLFLLVTIVRGLRGDR